MRNLLFSLTFALSMTAGVARADPVTVALIANGVSIGSAITATYGATVAFVLRIGASLLLSAAATALVGKPKAASVNRELQVPNSRPPYRSLYGRARVYGSYAPCVAQDGILYACLVLNSRPSSGNFTFYFDKREVFLSGDIYDFAGSGATATNSPFSGYVNIWVGRGDQTGPPAQILTEAPDLFLAADGWRGRTVAWLRLDRGPSDGRVERWPRVPPEVEVEADWSLVWDPRDVAQDPDDPATWTFSRNQALCLLDAIRNNPIRVHRLENIAVDQFISAADIADEAVPRKDLSTEPRYQANGLIVWSEGEVLDKLRPLEAAGAGTLARMGGKLGYVAGAWRAPSYTMTAILEEGGIDLQRWQPGRELPTAIRASYIATNRDWQDSELPALPIVGADQIDGSEDGIAEIALGMVTSPTQAMRIQQIAARRAAAQRRLSVMLPPNAFDLVSGAILTGNMPAGFTRLNGLWEVQSINPGLWTTDIEGGVAMRCPVTLAETAESHFSWNPDTDQFDIVTESFVPGLVPVQVPIDGAATGGAGQISVSFTMPVKAQGDQIEFWGSDTDDVALASLLATVTAPSGATRTFVETGLLASTTRYYFARALVVSGRASSFTASVSATTDA